MDKIKKEKSLVTPEILCGKIPFFMQGVKRAILTYSDQSGFVFKNFSSWKRFSFASKTFLKKNEQSDTVIVGDMGIGAPAAIAACEELRWMGVKEIYSVGSAGSLTSSLNTGDLIICDSAYIDEGTSTHYGKKLYDLSFADESLVEKLKVKLTSKRFDFIKGPSWTTDAPYRETRSKIENYIKQGVLTVEMEASALYSFSSYYKDIDILCLFIISDSFSQGVWKGDFSSSKIKDTWQKVFSILELK